LPEPEILKYQPIVSEPNKPLSTRDPPSEHAYPQCIEDGYEMERQQHRQCWQ